MLNRIGHRRNLRMAVAAIMAPCAIASATAGCTNTDDVARQQYCAIFGDTAGLYVGNPVTQMGYKIGAVESVEATGMEVRVTFALSTPRRIPQDAKAVIRSPSLLADRSLELVGNYTSGPQLAPKECVPRNRTFSPQSISQVIGSATNLIDGINPEGSTNLQDSLQEIHEASKGAGPELNRLLTVSSELMDSPDQSIADLGNIVENVVTLTGMLKDNRKPLKQIYQDLPEIGPDLVTVTEGADRVSKLPELIQMVNDIELNLGGELQLALDTTSDTLRHAAVHYKGIANVLNPIPRFLNGLNFEPPGATEGGLMKHINNHQFALLPWRPPLFRIGTHDGLATCGIMNASMPGSCADVAGQPYAVDVALLQYVLTEATR